MTEEAGIAALEDQIVALEDSLGGAQAVARAFDGEMRRMQATVREAGRDVAGLSSGLTKGLRKSLDGVLFDGMKLSDALKGVARSMADSAYRAAVKPATEGMGGLLSSGVQSLVSGLLPNAKGNSFAQGRVMPFARGGVVDRPTTFPMRGATGLMGEAGPEAILPLARGPDGSLGVRAGGGAQAAPVQVVMNIQTPDVEGFRRSQSQIAAQMGRALGQGRRNR